MPFAAPGQTIVSSGDRRIVVGSPRGSYAEFIQHIEEMSDPVAWDGSVNNASVFQRVTCAAPTGVMTGTPWLEYMHIDSIMARAVQHSMPSEGVFNENVSSGRQVVMQMGSIGTVPEFVSLNRNGYASVASLDPAFAIRCSMIIYWNHATGRSEWLNPHNGELPQPYDW